MANKGVISKGYQYKNGKQQLRRQTDAYTLNLGVTLDQAFVTLGDVDPSAEYLVNDSDTGIAKAYMLKESTILGLADGTILATTPVTPAIVSSMFLVSRLAAAGAGGIETDPVFTSQKGANNGVATLDATGKVPLSQLPTSLGNDDVLEFATQSIFPPTGAVGKVYIDLAADTAFVWDTTTSAYKSLGGATTGATISNFSPTTAYTTGQLIISANKIYQANAATPAGTFNVTQWTEISPSVASASVITTQTVTVTGNLTPAQETVLVAGFNKNTTTGEVWFKDAAGIVTKLEKQGSAMCISSPLTPIAASGSFTYNHALNDLEPLIQVLDANNNVVTSAVNVTTKIIDANNVRVTIGSVAGSYKVKVCSGSFTTLTLAGGGATTNTLTLSGNVLTSTVNLVPATVTLPAATNPTNTLTYVPATGVLTSTVGTGTPATVTIPKAYYYISDQVVDTVINGDIFLDGSNGGTNIINLPLGITKGKLTKAPLTITRTDATPSNVAFTVKLKKYVRNGVNGANSYSQDLVTYTIPANVANMTIIDGVLEADTDLYQDFRVYITISGATAEQANMIFVIANPTIELS
jgi:hypothetical protein